MKKYLTFSGAGFNFVLPAGQIVELFDAHASAEPLSKVLVGESESVYWRGVLSVMLDVQDLLAEMSDDIYHCYIVCRGAEIADGYYILKVKHIDDLRDIVSSQFRIIDIDNPVLAKITGSVCIMNDTDQLYFLLHDFETIFNNMSEFKATI